MTIQLCERSLQHLAVARVAGGLELLGKALPGKKEAIALPVMLLLLRGDRDVEAISWSGSFFLLLFYRLTFPAARHYGNLTSKWIGSAKKHLVCDWGRE